MLPCIGSCWFLNVWDLVDWLRPNAFGHFYVGPEGHALLTPVAVR